MHALLSSFILSSMTQCAEWQRQKANNQFTRVSHKSNQTLITVCKDLKAQLPVSNTVKKELAMRKATRAETSDKHRSEEFLPNI